MPYPRFASIDVGSNTLRLLLAEKIEQDHFYPLRVERIITRLGGNFAGEKNLDENSMGRTLAALRSFADLLSKEKVEAVFSVATGVIREARNGREFIERARKETGLPLRLISGEEEACLMLKGVLYSLNDKSATYLITDLGGWSTEIIWVEQALAKKIKSVGLGAVALCENFLKHDPPRKRELALMDEHIKRMIGEIRAEFEKEGLAGDQYPSNLIGTAGTMTTLAAIDQKLLIYDPQKVNNHWITLSRLKSIFKKIISLPLSQRLIIPGLEKGREDLIVAGAAIAICIMEVFTLRELVVIDTGLLEGILLDGISRLS